MLPKPYQKHLDFLDLKTNTFWSLPNLIRPFWFYRFSNHWFLELSKTYDIHLDFIDFWFLEPSKPYPTHLDFIVFEKNHIFELPKHVPTYLDFVDSEKQWFSTITFDVLMGGGLHLTNSSFSRTLYMITMPPAGAVCNKELVNLWIIKRELANI